MCYQQQISIWIFVDHFRTGRNFEHVPIKNLLSEFKSSSNYFTFDLTWMMFSCIKLYICFEYNSFILVTSQHTTKHNHFSNWNFSNDSKKTLVILFKNKLPFLKIQDSKQEMFISTLSIFPQVFPLAVVWCPSVALTCSELRRNKSS